MESSISLLTQYGYLILFPLAVVEGPIITIIGGFLVSLGILDFVWVYLIVIGGDVVGDTFYYALGRWGSGPLARHGHRLGLTQERLARAREFFNNHHGKAIITTKLAQGIGPVGLIAAGTLHVPYKKYITTCFVVTCCQAAVFLVAGFFFGHAYNKIAHYLDYTAAFISAVVLIVVFLFILKKLKISRA